MKLKKWELPEPTRAGAKSLTPAIHVSRKGRIGFNRAAVAHMGLKAKDRLSIFEDEDDKGVCYLGMDKEGTVLRANAKGEISTQNAAMAKMILDAFAPANATSMRILVAGQPVKVGKQVFYGLIPLKS